MEPDVAAWDCKATAGEVGDHRSVGGGHRAFHDRSAEGQLDLVQPAGLGGVPLPHLVLLLLGDRPGVILQAEVGLHLAEVVGAAQVVPDDPAVIGQQEAQASVVLAVSRAGDGRAPATLGDRAAVLPHVIVQVGLHAAGSGSVRT